MEANESIDLTGLENPDFLALGVGATNMMAMLWSLAMGRRVVGVEMRGDPSLGVHWNIREDLYHHLGFIDELMLERYGADRLPRRGDGRVFRLQETFYGEETFASDAFADEVIGCYEPAHVTGRIYHTEFIDDRYVDGEPSRRVTVLTPPKPSPIGSYDPKKVGRSVYDVLDGPSTFQAGAGEVMVMLRRYLEELEEMDLAAGVEPRVRLLLSHRVVDDSQDGGLLGWLKQHEGFVTESDGRKRIYVEEVRELDYGGRFHRSRVPGTEVIDLGVPEVFMIAQGFNSSDADRLGFVQETVKVDHNDGRGPSVAQADYLAGALELHVGARLRRRIASEFDEHGNEFWVRQLAVGHECDPEVGWILVQVPDFKRFDPVKVGLVAPGTPKESKDYVSAYQHLLRDYYLEQVALVTEIPKDDLANIQSPYGPKMFSLIEKVGASALIAPNGVVAGDSFGNGHFLTSGGAVTGMVGHAYRMYEYWKQRDGGADPDTAIAKLAESIKEDTNGWLLVSAREFSQALPINFGGERIAEIKSHAGREDIERANTVESARRHRHALVPLDVTHWRSLTMKAGRLYTHDLPPLNDTHPALRTDEPAMAMSEAPMPMRPAMAPMPSSAEESTP